MVCVWAEGVQQWGRAGRPSLPTTISSQPHPAACTLLITTGLHPPNTNSCLSTKQPTWHQKTRLLFVALIGRQLWTAACLGPGEPLLPLIPTPCCQLDGSFSHRVRQLWACLSHRYQWQDRAHRDTCADRWSGVLAPKVKKNQFGALWSTIYVEHPWFWGFKFSTRIACMEIISYQNMTVQ